MVRSRTSSKDLKAWFSEVENDSEEQYRSETEVTGVNDSALDCADIFHVVLRNEMGRNVDY